MTQGTTGADVEQKALSRLACAVGDGSARGVNETITGSENPARNHRDLREIWSGWLRRVRRCKRSA